MERVAYGGWPNCVRLSNGVLELVATTDVGPRLIRFGLLGGSNVFREWPEQLGKTGGEGFRIYGGHRLWHGPEDPQRTYVADNQPVQWNWHEGTLRLTAPTETLTGLQKEMEIVMDPSRARVTVRHRLINRGLKPVTTMPWSISVMPGPGRAIVPQEPYVAHAERLLPARTMTLWAYTDMRDPRYTWGTKYVQIACDPGVNRAQKIGFMNTVGWAAYAGGGTLFVKRFGYDARALYADLGCNVEVYTGGDMLELETMGRLAPLAPGATAEHVEVWHLFPATLDGDDNLLETKLLPLIRPTEPPQDPPTSVPAGASRGP